MVLQFYLSMGCLLFLIVGRHDVKRSINFLYDRVEVLDGKKIELVDSMEVQRRDRPRCLGIGNSTQVQIIILLYHTLDSATIQCHLR